MLPSAQNYWWTWMHVYPTTSLLLQFGVLEFLWTCAKIRPSSTNPWQVHFVSLGKGRQGVSKFPCEDFPLSSRASIIISIAYFPRGPGSHPKWMKIHMPGQHFIELPKDPYWICQRQSRLPFLKVWNFRGINEINELRSAYLHLL